MLLNPPPAGMILVLRRLYRDACVLVVEFHSKRLKRQNSKISTVLTVGAARTNVGAKIGTRNTLDISPIDSIQPLQMASHRVQDKELWKDDTGGR